MAQDLSVISETRPNFSITNASTFGRLLGTGATSYTEAVTINIGGSFAGIAGNTFDFTTGNFNNATLGTLPTITNAGLTWDTTQFINSGILTVVSAVPEPSTYASLAGILVLGVVVYRKRHQVA